MDYRYMLKVSNMRKDLGFPIIVNSGFRCPDHNERVSSTGRTGPHTTGCAADFGVSRHRANQLLNYAFGPEDGFMTRRFKGIGIKQHGAQAGRFIHLDELSERVWTYD